jgi:hypothetical protein
MNATGGDGEGPAGRRVVFTGIRRGRQRLFGKTFRSISLFENTELLGTCAFEVTAVPSSPACR